MLKITVMELVEVIEKRTSIRNFKKSKVSIEDIREMVRRGGLAPSVNNFQPWRFIYIESDEVLNELAQMISDKYQKLKFKESRLTQNIKQQVEWFSTFFTEAPGLLLMVMTDYETVLEKSTDLSHEVINQMRGYPDIQSAGACAQNILLSAVDLGYGACWMSGPLIAREEMESKLRLKPEERLISLIAIGYPEREVNPKKKDDLGSKLEIIQ